jgi:hypothetical protein
MLARERFAKARRRADREEWLARVAGRPRGLLAYRPALGTLHVYEPLANAPLSTIQLDRIVGSVGHNRDFTPGFWPRASVSPERWVTVDVAMGQPAGVPPIEVFQVGDRYFVADGNHRVSVAKANGLREIEAYVTVVTLPGEDRSGASGPCRPAAAATGFRPLLARWLRRLRDHAASLASHYR